MGFSWGEVTKWRCYWIFDQLWLALDANPMSRFFGSIFLETRWSSVYIEPLIDLLACLEPKLWPQKHFTPNSENCRKSMSLPLAACADSDNSPREHDRELFEPSRDSWSLAVCTEKKLEVWVWGFRWVSSRLVFLLWRHRPDNKPKLCLKFGWILGSNMNL